MMAPTIFLVLAMAMGSILVGLPTAAAGGLVREPRAAITTTLPTRPSTTDFIAEADSNRDGAMSMAEIAEYVRKNHKLNYTKSMFDRLDLNHDGVHSFNEIKLAQTVNDASIPVLFNIALKGGSSADMVKDGDVDTDGELTLTEAAACLSKTGTTRVVPILLTRFDLTRDGALGEEEIDAARVAPKRK